MYNSHNALIPHEGAVFVNVGLQMKPACVKNLEFVSASPWEEYSFVILKAGHGGG